MAVNFERPRWYRPVKKKNAQGKGEGEAEFTLSTGNGIKPGGDKLNRLAASKTSKKLVAVSAFSFGFRYSLRERQLGQSASQKRLDERRDARECRKPAGWNRKPLLQRKIIRARAPYNRSFSLFLSLSLSLFLFLSFSLFLCFCFANGYCNETKKLKIPLFSYVSIYSC